MYRKGEFHNTYRLFPNPANSAFKVFQTNGEKSENDHLEIDILAMDGKQVLHTSVSEGESIDISILPVGIYQVYIQKDGVPTEVEKMVKM
ncbi:MAG: T9SS type A sorting domain-containing protein [Chitinophagales bacterium]